MSTPVLSPRRGVALLAQPRYEILPLSGIDEQVRTLPAGTTVTITCSPRKGLEPSLELVERLAGAGLDLVPHVAARQVHDHAHLVEVVERCATAGVTELFVVGGDASVPVGEFTAGLELLEALDALGHPFERIGVPAYPDGHPLIAPSTLEAVLLAKQRHATHMVTQLCFSSATIADWLGGARARGVHLPAYVGMPGVVERKKLLRVALRVGVGQSSRFLSKHRDLLTRVARPGGGGAPDSLVRGLAARLRPVHDVRGLHLYTFNHLTETAEWTARRLASAA